MLYEVNSIYCSRCKEFTPVFDAVNYDISATEIICSNCGKILLIMRTKYQSGTNQESNSNFIENYIRRENQKSAKSTRMHKILTGVNSV